MIHHNSYRRMKYLVADSSLFWSFIKRVLILCKDCTFQGVREAKMYSCLIRHKMISWIKVSKFKLSLFIFEFVGIMLLCAGSIN